MSVTLLWLFHQKGWLGAAALLYAFYIGCAAVSCAISKSAKGDGHRVPFQLIREFFFLLPRNIAGCFKGWKIAWHLVAIGLAVVLAASGFDWFYFGATRSPQLLAWMFPATSFGVRVPLLLQPLLLLAGMVFKRAAVTRTGWALGQAALISLALVELFKAVAVRPHPPYHLVFVPSAPSHLFHFGLLRGGIVYGWPSAHTAVAFAMAVTLFVLFQQNRWLGAAALLYAFCIGISVSMTIHWFSDFASGAVFGTIVGTTVGRSFVTMEFKDKARPHAARGCVKTPGVIFVSDQIFDMRDFDESSRWIGWSKK